MGIVGASLCILINGADGSPMAFFCQSRKTCSLHKLKVISSLGPHRHCGGQPTRILLSGAHGGFVAFSASPGKLAVCINLE